MVWPRLEGSFRHPSKQVQLWSQAMQLRGSSRWVLKTTTETDCTTSDPTGPLLCQFMPLSVVFPLCSPWRVWLLLRYSGTPSSSREHALIFVDYKVTDRFRESPQNDCKTNVISKLRLEDVLEICQSLWDPDIYWGLRREVLFHSSNAGASPSPLTQSEWVKH